MPKCRLKPAKCLGLWGFGFRILRLGKLLHTYWALVFGVLVSLMRPESSD